MRGLRFLLISFVVWFFFVSHVWALVDHDPIVITGDAGFVSGGFPGSGTVGDPFRVEGLRIVTDALHRNGVEVRDTSVYFVVRGCVIEADYIGVLVDGAADGTAMILGNVVTGRTGDGGGITLSTDGVLVLNNTCSGFIVGLHTNYADRCIFQYNNFSYNTYYGLNIRFSDDCLITRNTVVGNGGHGISLIRDSTGNMVYNNTMARNGGIGSYEWDYIYSYTISSQGCDEGRGNMWYDEETQTGNKWSDYSGEGEYLLDGSAGSVDKYPLSAEAPVVNPVDDNSGIPGFGLFSIAISLIVFGLRRAHIRNTRLG